jgi:hypothetical protein
MKYLLYLLLLIIIICITSCAPVYKSPLTHPVHFSGKKELDGAVMLGTGGINASVAYSVTNHFFLKANGHYFTDDNLDSVLPANLPKDLTYHVDLAAGYYRYFSNFGFFSVSGGAGGGYGLTFTDAFPQDYLYHQGYYYRLFLQPQIGYDSKNLEAGVMPRVSYVHFTRFATNGSLIGLTSSPFFEPLLYFNVGGDRLKFCMQGGVSLPVGSKPAFHYNSVSFGVGIYFHLPFSKNQEL